MARFLDSAVADQAARAVSLGFVARVTTSPTLIARTGQDARQVISDLCAMLQRAVFHQVRKAPGPALHDLTGLALQEFASVAGRAG
jgi:hypothetical protein